MTLSTPLETVRRYLAGEITERQACDWFDCDRLAFREEIDALVAAVNASYLTTPSREALAATPAPLDVSRLARALRPMCDCIRSDSDAEAWARDIAAAYQADEP
jgi:hypothetical protein